MQNKRFARTLLLVKEEGFQKLQNASVLLLGVGGVGSFVLDCLYRTGVGKICIVDYDSFDITNQNRQIGAFEGVGRKKVEVLGEKYPGILSMDSKITQEFIDTFDFSAYDIVIDAIDDINAKIALAMKIANQPKKSKKSESLKMPHLLVSTGSAKKLDPSKIQFAPIWKSYGDKFARKFREGLKKQGFKGDFMVAFSPEEPKCKELGSFCGVTASFGLRLASEAVALILRKE
ncbi:tRNA threonylcarbamoyladenosine dehydratase [Helicobacter sp. MIT 11-5569]|uniref:ThiF family adenylyltransferase n=1 Tax=Helicobacter sp. MIT 11-5569 TaxID=1548151 RepID=UPI00051FF34D|nr:ThiF family adenylyltransferase [Helicobacter sp. MIT 11-5569]TLD85263.1 tRNA threonylcarbamoyladenosine dehydratase [Helicobacter sp. MIT 11-5569]